MDWKEVGSAFVSKGLPLLGAVLGGPAGGAIGAGVSGLLSSALGLTSDEIQPNKILEMMTTDPTAITRLREIESNNKVELQRLIVRAEELRLVNETQRIIAVNQTMQAESKSEHWAQWAWRPYWGFISGTTFLVVAVFVCVLGYKAVTGSNPQAIGMIPLLVGAFTTLFGVPGAILGISAWGRNKLKIKN